MEGGVCPPYNKVFVYVQRALFTNVSWHWKFLKIQTNNESGRIIYELKMKLGRTATNITKLKETSFTMWHL